VRSSLARCSTFFDTILAGDFGRLRRCRSGSSEVFGGKHLGSWALAETLHTPSFTVVVPCPGQPRRDANRGCRSSLSECTIENLVIARIIDGKSVSAALRAQVAAGVAAAGFSPGLAVVLVGDDAASNVYVRTKDRAAREAGIQARTIRLPAETPQQALLSAIQELNDDPAIDGILIQLPLPRAIDPRAVIEAIDPAKDVDGFHPLNVGHLADGRPTLVPCTALGVMKLLRAVGREVAGSRALVVGRSAIVGRPMARLLLAADATVTVAHSRTHDLPAECRRADILIAAIGKPEMIQADWVRRGATVIDVGINRLPDGQLVGDVAFQSCSTVAAAITPVPGGVGPMTVACLLENTLTAALRRRAA
jgi:methylenetetrahydrofolate dehydrogenase (NADP+)/methenyltetrahydrofolate cyclohydrolase